MSSKKDRVIIGLDGRIESAVAALLLKKQGHDCVGVNISFVDKLNQEESDFLLNHVPVKNEKTKKLIEDDAANIENARILKKKDYIDSLKVWSSESEEKVKDLCRLIGIPFYVTNAIDHFEEEVLAKMIESRVVGYWNNPSISRAKVIFNILESKLETLKAQKISTGHFCKISNRQGAISLSAPNDIDRSDAHIISQLDEALLSKCILPLADLRYEEVLKIGELLKSKTSEDSHREDRKLFFKSDFLGELCSMKVAPKLLNTGIVANIHDDSQLGEHLGHHLCYVGQTGYKLKDKKPKLTDSRIVSIHRRSGLVMVAKNKELTFSRVVFDEAKYSSSVDLTKPLNCFAYIVSKNEYYEGKLYIKNGANGFFSLEEAQNGKAFRGDDIVFYNKKSAGAKVIGRAKINSSGSIIDGEFQSLPLSDKQIAAKKEAATTSKKKELGF